MATLCEQVLIQVSAYNIGFRLPTLAYGQLVVGDINNQRRAISYSTDNLLSKNNLKQVVTRFVCVRITDDVPREIHKRNFQKQFCETGGASV